ncbi:MAG: MOSC domain-containing protein [Clostridiales Family XIII bacterium]|jgi:MOSC domain-containing protein YiiM|nr:MOSC domain-containing protein [Clostridiales Family XIII bacterium]
MKKDETNGAKVLSVNISDKTGVIKKPVTSAELEPGGVVGDAHFGLSDIKQVSLLADESADKMRRLGLTLDAGAFAENITTVGVNLAELPIGARLRIGESLHEVSQIGKECHEGCAIKQQTGTCVMPTEGIFTRVIEGGAIKPGDAIAVL